MVRVQTLRRRILKGLGATGDPDRSTGGMLPALVTSHLNGGDFEVLGGLPIQVSPTIIGQTAQKVLGEPQTRENLDKKKLGPISMQYYWYQCDNDTNETAVDIHLSMDGSFPNKFEFDQITRASAFEQSTDDSG